MESNRAKRKRVYAAINDVASPGDVLFRVTLDFKDDFFTRYRNYGNNLTRLVKKTPIYEFYTHLMKKSKSLSLNEDSIWHTNIYSGIKKSRSYDFPLVISATDKFGIIESQFDPSNFSSKKSEDNKIISKSVTEVVSLREDLDAEQREQIVGYCREQLGKKFHKNYLDKYMFTYFFGVSLGKSNQEMSCMELAYRAYNSIGINFGHALVKEDLPFFNIAKYLGHPLNHSKDHMNFDFPYCHDYHLYRNNLFAVKLSISQNDETDEYEIRENPGKYSWDKNLKKEYAKYLKN